MKSLALCLWYESRYDSRTIGAEIVSYPDTKFFARPAALSKNYGGPVVHSDVSLVPRPSHSFPSLAVRLSVVSQARPTSAREGRGSGEQRIQAVSRRTVQCGTITLQYFVT